MAHGVRIDYSSPQATQLLRSVAEQLKLPLTTIARQAELGQLQSGPGIDLQLMQTQAQVALMLVDSYLLGLRLLDRQAALELEPVSVSSLLVEAAHELDKLARHYQIVLNVSVAGKYEPVMAHREGLRAALLSLGFALIGSQPGGNQLTLAVHRVPQGIVTGVYGAYESLTLGHWRKALQLCGSVRQPLVALTGDSAAGLFVADALAQAMDTRLLPGRHLKQQGLTIKLQPSHQLQLV